ncbi:MAG TPA: hypothetical protein VI916_10770 [Acidimicrobiia bacterium]|nr:hypothetical protein [Acidimicrobiia bacterium]
MAKVSVQPEEFTFVNYDAKRIIALAEEMAAHAGLGDDVAITIEIDEKSPFGYTTSAVDGPTVTIFAESAAFEDAKNLRELSEEGSRQVLGRLLYRVGDRMDPAFGDPPPDKGLSFEQSSAWNAYAMGRLERAGYFAHKERRRYAFRIRHGFTDVADQVFDRLWASETLTWADIEAACAQTAAVRPERETKGPKSKAKAKAKAKAGK